MRRQGRFDPAQYQHGAAARPLSARRAVDRLRPARTLENDHFRGWPADSCNGRAVRCRGRDERADVPRLREAMSRSHAQARRYRDPVHRLAGVKEAIEAAGATLLYLPPYSPDLNPIELAFSKLKAHLRQAAEHTIPGLSRRIGRVVTAFSPQECRNFFHHVGYIQT